MDGDFIFVVWGCEEEIVRYDLYDFRRWRFFGSVVKVFFGMFYGCGFNDSFVYI